MVQKSRAIEIVLQIFSRLGLFIAALVIGSFFFSIQIHDFVVNTLGYQTPPNPFDIASWADWDVAWYMATSFWIGIIFGTLGKKIDYIFIAIFFVLFSLDYLYTGNMTWLVYSGLVGTTLIGNIIGFGLKLLLQRFWGKKI